MGGAAEYWRIMSNRPRKKEAVAEDEAAFEDHNETVMQKKLTSDRDLEAGYELMAQDKAREEEAIEWIKGTSGKIAAHFR